MKSKFHLTLKKKIVGFSVLSAVASALAIGCGEEGSGDLQYVQPLNPSDINFINPSNGETVCADFGSEGIVAEVKVEDEFCGLGRSINAIVRLRSIQQDNAQGSDIPLGQFASFGRTAAGTCVYKGWPMQNLDQGNYYLTSEGGTISTIFNPNSRQFKSNGYACGNPFYAKSASILMGKLVDSPSYMLSSIADPATGGFHFDAANFSQRAVELASQFGQSILTGAAFPIAPTTASNYKQKNSIIITMNGTVNPYEIASGNGGIYVIDYKNGRKTLPTSASVVGNGTQIAVELPPAGSSSFPCGSARGSDVNRSTTLYLFLSPQVRNATTGRAAKPMDAIVNVSWTCS